jgi:transcription antitermination factor NusG
MAGEEVAITQGPLKNYKGEILRIGSDNYALISFENFGQSLKVKLPKQILKKIA